MTEIELHKKLINKLKNVEPHRWKRVDNGEHGKVIGQNFEGQFELEIDSGKWFKQNVWIYVCSYGNTQKKVKIRRSFHRPNSEYRYEGKEAVKIIQILEPIAVRLDGLIQNKARSNLKKIIEAI